MSDLYFQQIAKNFPSLRELPKWLRQRFSLGKQIYMLRYALGMTQTQLANRIGSAQRSIVRLEKEEVDPRISTLQRLAEALNCELMVRFIPKKELEKFIEEKAQAKAKELLEQSIATANLELQKPSRDTVQIQKEQLIKTLLKKRSKLWED